MLSKTPRINISIEPKIASLLSSLAHEEHKSVAGLARELILEALERREDIALSTLAESREHQKHKLVSHDDAWK